MSLFFKRMFSILRLFFSLCLCVWVLLGASPAYAFRVGFFVFEPHAMVVDGVPGGAAVEYFRDYVAVEMGIKVEFEGPLPFGRLMQDFSAGEFDAVLLLAKSPERAKQFIYPEAPYGMMQSTLMVPKGFRVEKLVSPEQLNGMLIGYSRRAWRSSFMRHKSVQFDLVASEYATALNFKKFNEGRLEGVYSPDRAALLYRARQLPEMRPFKLLAVPDPAVGFYTVFRPSTPLETVRSYEAALRRAQAACPYDSVVQKYIAP